jgi:histidine triad (HIT) family protein
MEKNIFAKIRDGEASADIILKNDYITAFKDIDPSAPHHIIIIPNKEIKTLNDVKKEDANMLGHLFLAARDIAKELGIDESGYRLIMNCNKDGGQEVFYIHFHLVGGCPLGRILKLPKDSKKMMKN